ncbi:MAG TPA: hypothetical protein VID74_02395 [Gemmatimonadales bacterium]
MRSALEAVFTFLFKYPPRVFQRGELLFAPVIPRLALVAGLAAALLLVWLAARGLKGTRPVDRLVIGAMRITVFAVLAGCLLRPALGLTSAVPQRNVLAIALDDSRSMQIRDVDTTRRVAAEERVFADSTALVKRLSDKFALRFFRFGADASPIASASALSASGARTDLATMFASIRQELADVPIAGVVVVSDGADNSSSDLAAALVGLRIKQIPVYTVGVGRERFARDLSLDRFDLPATTLKGSGVLATATIGARGVSGDSVMLTTEADGHIVATQALRIPAGREVIDVPVRVPPLDVGTHVISVRVSPVPGEIITENNETQALLRVRGGFERVLYLEGEPRFEFAFLRRAFDGDSAVRLVGLLRSAKGKYLRINVNDSLDLVNGFPTRRDELFQYRGVILGSIEASYFTADQLRMLSDFVDRRGGALIALGGRQALAEGGFAGTALAEVLPFTLENHGRRAADTAMATVKVEPTSAGLNHPALQLGATPAANASRWDSLPPLTSVNHLGDLRAGAETLLVGQPLPRGERVPILAVQHYGRGLAAVLGVQDTWTWKMDPRSPVEDRTFETFWRQLVRWTLDQVPDRLEVAAVPERVGPGEPVTLRARVADSIYMDVNNAAVTAEVTTPTGAVTAVPLDWTMRDDGTYAGRFVTTEPGTYRYSVLAVSGGDSMRSAGNAILADARGSDMEHAELRTALLQRIARETGGKYYPIGDLARLPDDVLLTRSGITAHESRDLWDMPVVLLLLLALLGAEWGYRRWRGLA